MSKPALGAWATATSFVLFATLWLWPQELVQYPALVAAGLLCVSMALAATIIGERG